MEKQFSISLCQIWDDGGHSSSMSVLNAEKMRRVWLFDKRYCWEVGWKPLGGCVMGRIRNGALREMLKRRSLQKRVDQSFKKRLGHMEEIRE